MSIEKVPVFEDEILEKKPLFFHNLIWLTVKQAATYLSRTENAIRILIYRGALSAHRLGGRIHLKKAEIDHALEKSIFGGVYGS